MALNTVPASGDDACPPGPGRQTPRAGWSQRMRAQRI